MRLLSLAALTLVPLGAVSLPAGVVGALLAVFTGVAAIRTRGWPTVRLAMMVVLLAVAGGSGIPFAIWLVVGAMWLVGHKVPELVPASGWLPRGSSGPVAWWLVGMTVVGAGAALTAWARWTDRFGEGTIDAVEAIRPWPVALLVPAVVVFVIGNAVTEEIAFRGIAYETAAALFPPIGAVLAQAVAFGTLHVAGFPAGLLGVGMAFGYGLALGTIRHLTAGLRLPVIAHMAADATIAILALTIIPS